MLFLESFCRNPDAMEVILLKEKEKSLSSTKPKVSLDAVLKDFFQDRERLADLLNAALMEGNPFISSDMVETMDSDSSSVAEVEEGCFATGRRQRDKVSRIRLAEDKSFIVGVEFQSTVDYRMVLRILYYICDTLAREEKQGSVPLNIVSLVLFTGEGRWGAKTSLREYSKRIEDKRLNELFFDFSYEVCDFKKLDTERLRNKEVRDAIEGIQMVYAGTEEILKERREISKASLLVIVAATGRGELYEEIMKERGERFVMCEAFERWTREKIEIGWKEGKAEGRAEGRTEGINIGRAEGKTEGERKYCIKMLEIKFGKLSADTRLRIMNSSQSQFEQLSKSLFSIKNEAEAIEYLN